MDKPDWSEAPEWARYVAQDKSGEWYWFEHEPKKESGGYWYLDRRAGQTEQAHKEEWTLTLESRP